MAKLKFVFLLLIILGVVGYACKKEPVDSKVFMEKYLLGRWYINTYVEMEITNNDTTHLDTLYAVSTSDTSRIWVSYTEDKQFIKGASTVPFAVDEKGESITFSTNPDSTWFMPYVRTRYFKLAHIRKETVGSDIHQYIIEQEFRKQ